MQVKLSDFDFDLPDRLIATRPARPRSGARMLAVTHDRLTDAHAIDLPSFLAPGDRLVLNDTKVIPARLSGIRKREGPDGVTEARIEATLLEPQADGTWSALLKPLKRVRDGETIAFDADLHAARATGAVAAPTASLHFDHALLEALDARGVERSFVTLHVGAGTFLPVKTDDVRDHKMHAERGVVSDQAATEINATRRAGGRIVPVGTTAMRLLETAALDDGRMADWQGATDIFITPGYRFKICDALMTNFHLPKSTLMMLVSAFMGQDRMRQVYAHAIMQNYRFFSYGDASLLMPGPR